MNKKENYRQTVLQFLYNEIQLKCWNKYNFLVVCASGCGFICVQREDGKFNFACEENGKLISNEWFTEVNDFYKGYALVKREDGKFNHIDANGKFLSNEWWTYATDFYDGNAFVVKNKENCNYIDTDGKFLFNEWIHGNMLYDITSNWYKSLGLRLEITTNK